MFLSHSDITSTSTVAETALGQVGYWKGKIFRYAKAGGTALSRGKLVVAPTVVANHVNLSFQTAPAVGDTTVLVTLGATAATADQYAGGQFVVQDGTGEGRSYRIQGNKAADSAGTCTVYLDEAIDTAGALSEANVDLIANDYNGVVISAADQADRALGVPVVAIAASSYGWIQTGGYAAVLADEAVNPGIAVTIGSSTVGAVEALDGAGEQEVGIVGPTALVDTEYKAVFLTLDRSVSGGI